MTNKRACRVTESQEYPLFLQKPDMVLLHLRDVLAEL
jgi:hypothetical protein